MKGYDKSYEISKYVDNCTNENLVFEDRPSGYSHDLVTCASVYMSHDF